MIYLGCGKLDLKIEGGKPMTVDKSVYKLLRFIEERKIVSLVTIENNFTKLSPNETKKLLQICCQAGYVENIQLHSKYHQIGTYGSNNYQLTVLGRQLFERHNEKKRQKYYKLICIIVTALLLPLAVNLIGLILAKHFNLP